MLRGAVLAWGHNFRLGAQAVIWGTQAVIWGTRPRNTLRGVGPVSGAGGLRFKSRASQIKYSVATARRRCDISSKGAVLLKRSDAEMGLANTLHASAQYNEYHERFDFDLMKVK